MSDPTIKDMLNVDREVRGRIESAQQVIKKSVKSRKEAVKNGKRSEARQAAAREGSLI